MQNYRRKILGISSIIVIIIEIIVIIITILYSSNKQDDYLAFKLSKFENEYNKITAINGNIADVIFQESINTKRVKNILSAINFANTHDYQKIRDSLYNEIIYTFENIRNYNFQQIHFHLPNNTSFLRVNKPEQFGENLTELRPMIANSSKNKVVNSGFENGYTFSGYRYIYPILENDSLLATVEISITGKSLLNQINKNFNFLTKIIIRKDLISKNILDNENNRYHNCDFNHDFIVTDDVYVSFEEIAKEKNVDLKLIYESTKKRIFDAEYNESESISYSLWPDANYLVYLLPLKDFNGKPFAYIIAFETNKFEQNNVLKQIIVILMITLILLSFQFFITHILLNAKKLQIKSEELLEKQVEIDTFKTKLSESENLFYQMFVQSTAIQLIVDPLDSGRIIDANESALKFYGYTKQELVNQTVSFINVLSPEELAAKMREIRQKGSDVFEVPHKLKSGEIKIVQIHSSNITLGERNLILPIIRDITEFKNAQKKVQEALDLLYNFSQQVPGTIYQYQAFPDNTSRFPFASKGIEQIYEVTPEEVAEDASKVFTRIHPDDFDSVVESIFNSRDNLTVWKLDYRVVLPKRGTRWLRGEAQPQQMPDGSVLWHGYISDVTKSKLLSIQKEESEKNFKNIFESIQDMIFVADESGKILFANSAVEGNLGYNVEEIKGKHLLDLHDEKDQEEARRIVQEMIERKTDYSLLPLKAKNKRIIQGETRIWFGKWNNQDVIFGIVKNLTEIQAALDKFNKLFESNPALMALNDIETTQFLEINNAFVSTLGFSRSEVIGKTPAELEIFPDFELQNAARKKLMQKGRIRNTKLTVKSKSGRLYEGLFSGELIDNMGKLNFLTVMVDITEQVKTEQQLQQINMEKDKFFSILAHDLKGPFGGLIGLIKLLKNDIISFKEDEIEEIIDSMYSTANKIYDLLEDLLEWSRLQRKVIKYSPKNLIVREIIDVVGKLFKVQLENKCIQLKIKTESSEIIYADKMMVTTIIRNIISNAIKFTRQNGIIEISWFYLDDKVRIKIKDNGIGMSENTQSTLFQIDKTISNFGTNNETGTGLGLIICKEFANINSGNISFESKLDLGTSFYIDLPSGN